MSDIGYIRARKYARRLRKNQTRTETIIWKALRNRSLLGKKFLRQHPIFADPYDNDAFFIADFYCHEHRLVIELDGEIHESQQ